MDPRHESLEQITLNELIDLINSYVRDHVDDVLTDESLAADIHKVAYYIYRYARTPIDLNSLLSRKNLLSIDVVLLPKIDELNFPDIETGNDFGVMLEAINKVAEDRYPELVSDQQFHKCVREILNARIA